MPGDTHTDNFAVAVDYVLAHEGGFVDHPADPGGATNWGVSLRFLRGQDIDLGDVDGDGDIDADDIAAMTRDQAIVIYRTAFWRRYRYHLLPETIDGLVFDMAVNMGPAPAHRTLQRACWAFHLQIADDGILGSQTRGAAETIVASFKGNATPLAAAIRAERAGFYRTLVARRPSLGAFLKGWLRRTYA